MKLVRTRRRKTTAVCFTVVDSLHLHTSRRPPQHDEAKSITYGDRVVVLVNHSHNCWEALSAVF